MSPVLKLDVRAVTYNADRHELFIECGQIFHIRWSPFRGRPARYVVIGCVQFVFGFERDSTG